VNDLNNKKVTVEKGYATEEFLIDIKKQIENFEYDLAQNLLLDLRNMI